MALYDRAHQLFTKHLPHALLHSQAVQDWQGVFPLPDPLIDYYMLLGPVQVTLPSYGNLFFLPALAELWDFQAGYRWNALTQTDDPEWNDDWLVIADQGGDPFIFSRATHTILHAYHGEDIWNPIELFPNLDVMVSCFVILSASSIQSKTTVTNTTVSTKRSYLQSAKHQLQALLGSEETVDHLLERLG